MAAGPVGVASSYAVGYWVRLYRYTFCRQWDAVGLAHAVVKQAGAWVQGVVQPVGRAVAVSDERATRRELTKLSLLAWAASHSRGCAVQVTRVRVVTAGGWWSQLSRQFPNP